MSSITFEKFSLDHKVELLLFGILFALGLIFVLIPEPEAPPPVRASETMLEQVLQKNKLDVLVRNSINTYFHSPDGPAGFEYELLRGFADDLGVELSVNIAESPSKIIPDVMNKRYDLGAAMLTINENRSKLVSFSYPFTKAKQQLLYNRDAKKPKNLGDIKDGVFEVISGSSYANSLKMLKVDYPDLTWEEKTDKDTDNLLELLANKSIDYTVLSSIDVDIHKRFYPDIGVAFDVSDEQPIAWVFSKTEDTSLIQRAEQYLVQVEANGKLAELKEKYYGHIDGVNAYDSRFFLKDVNTLLPLYQDFFKVAAEQYGLEWQLLAAMSYQESHWKKDAESPTGVRGLMMLTLKTAKDLKVADREDPEESIIGAAKYMRSLIDRLPEEIQEPHRTWMAMAAYNVGLGHIRDVRKITEQRDGNPGDWRDVEANLPLLSDPKWYKKTRYGYARGREPVQYVRNIRNYYDMLNWLTTEQPESTVPNEEVEPEDGDNVLPKGLG